jgi:phage terminase small subunit
MRETTNFQDKFVTHIVYDGVSGTEAARRAGYSHASARQASSTLLATPHIQAAIRNEQYKHLNGTLASKAIKTLETIMDDPNSPAGARVDCAKTILDRAGLIAPKSLAVSPFDNKPVHEMTKSELEEFIEKTKKLIDDHESKQPDNVIDGELVEN